jgi:hypothetical protein
MGYSPEEATILINKLKSRIEALEVVYDYDSSEVANILDYGADGTGLLNDTQALVDAVASGKRVIWFPPNKTFLLNTLNSVSSAYYVNIPADTILRIDGKLTSNIAKTISFVFKGSTQIYGTGSVEFNQGSDSQVFQFTTGSQIRVQGLTFKGGSATSHPDYLCQTDPGSGETALVFINNCRFINYCGSGYWRNSNTTTSTHKVSETIISNCYFDNIYNGNGILINNIAGSDRNISIYGNVFNGCNGDNNGAAFNGFPIGVAGYGSLPFSDSQTTANILIANNLITTARTGIHVEYCHNIVSTGNMVSDIKASTYPNGTESTGIVFYGCSNWTSSGDTVRNVDGDTIYAWGFRATGGRASSIYQQSNKDFTIKGGSLQDASFLIEQQIPINTIGSVSPYELTTSSVCNFIDNTAIRGCAHLQVVGTVNVKNNDLVAPLSSNPLTVTSYSRSGNVATLVVTMQNNEMGIKLEDVVNITGVGSGFDAQYATVTSVTTGSASFTYANTGANVGTTSCSGYVRNMVKALSIDCNPTFTGNADYYSYYRLNLEVTSNTAKTVYGGSSFSLRNLTQVIQSNGTYTSNGRLPANLNVNFIGNNFGADTQASSSWPVTSTNRFFTTSQSSVPNAVEYCIGDVATVLGGLHRNWFCTTPGYVGPTGDTFTIVSAANGTIKKNGAYSWITYPPIYSLGEEIQVTNGTNTLVGICSKIEVSGANQVMTLKDPATGNALDLTTITGGAPAIQPYRVASFVLF